MKNTTLEDVSNWIKKAPLNDVFLVYNLVINEVENRRLELEILTKSVKEILTESVKETFKKGEKKQNEIRK